jgi:hypothetical protein
MLDWLVPVLIHFKADSINGTQTICKVKHSIAPFYSKERLFYAYFSPKHTFNTWEMQKRYYGSLSVGPWIDTDFLL